MRSLDRILGRLPRWQTAGFCFGLIAVIGAADYWTADERLIALFYLVPVSLGAWYVGRSFGLALSVSCTVTALVANWQRVHAVNLVGEIGVFVTVTMLVCGSAQGKAGADRRITIETRNAELDEGYVRTHAPVRTGPYVLLAVSDTGSGMDAATQAQVFEPFFTTKGSGEGTGLGLSTVYGIVKQSEGYVWVYSEVGVGTTFKIYLPRVDEEVEHAREEGPGPLLRGVETVLLVEDEESLREMLREVLDTNGYTVLVARDGAEAVTIAEAHIGTIHIMVTDVIMPRLTGPKLVDLSPWAGRACASGLSGPHATPRAGSRGGRRSRARPASAPPPAST